MAATPRIRSKGGKVAITAPLGFEHRVHTRYDPVHGEYVGLPVQWKNVVAHAIDEKEVMNLEEVKRLKPNDNFDGNWSVRNGHYQLRRSASESHSRSKVRHRHPSAFLHLQKENLGSCN